MENTNNFKMTVDDYVLILFRSLLVYLVLLFLLGSIFYTLMLILIISFVAYMFAWDAKVTPNPGPFIDNGLRILLSIVLFFFTFILLRRLWVPRNFKQWILSVIGRIMKIIPLKDEFNAKIILFQSGFICWAIIASVLFGIMLYLQAIPAGEKILPLFLKTKISIAFLASLASLPLSFFAFPKIFKEFNFYILKEKEKNIYFDNLSGNFNAVERSKALFSDEKYIKGFTKDKNIECSINAIFPIQGGNDSGVMTPEGASFKILIKAPNQINFVLNNHNIRGYEKVGSDKGKIFYLKCSGGNKSKIDEIINIIQKTNFLNDDSPTKVSGICLEKYNDSYIVVEKEGNIYETDPKEIYVFIEDIIRCFI